MRYFKRPFVFTSRLLFLRHELINAKASKVNWEPLKRLYLGNFKTIFSMESLSKKKPIIGQFCGLNMKGQTQYTTTLELSAGRDHSRWSPRAARRSPFFWGKHEFLQWDIDRLSPGDPSDDLPSVQWLHASLAKVIIREQVLFLKEWRSR